ncbi:MAG TPA: serine hydrolase domain-containing protein [Acidimicrobiales bacterium]|jgi:CubicO group peptidase (beta-lactamase class C family)|nr:serine hydrolase domain-containing protein [Acidimicrobiales bacterium]
MTDGWVADGYGTVADIFDADVARLGDGGGAFAAYVGGQPVVDLWGGHARPGVAWDKDTLSVIMSSTKGLCTMSAQVLFDRGLLDVDAPVAKYWPEFDQEGKGAILVRHVLTHTSGLLGFGSQVPPVGWDGSGWSDYDAIAAALAAAPAWWPAGTRFGYHATTYGWLVGELVRRIDGRTVGQFFHDEVAVPLGLDIWIGTPASEHDRVSTLVDHMSDGLPGPLRLLFGTVSKKMRDPGTLAGQAFIASGGTCLMDQGETLLNGRRALTAELPFGNGTATARSLARTYALLALGGELDGTRLVSADTVRRFQVQQISMPDQIMMQVAPLGTRWLMKQPVRRSLGYLLNPYMRGEKPRFGPNPNSYGHDGAGGQLAFCDPDRRISFGFIRSDLSSSSVFSRKLIDAVYAAAA